MCVRSRYFLKLINFYTLTIITIFKKQCNSFCLPARLQRCSNCGQVVLSAQLMQRDKKRPRVIAVFKVQADSTLIRSALRMRACAKRTMLP